MSAEPETAASSSWNLTWPLGCLAPALLGNKNVLRPCGSRWLCGWLELSVVSAAAFLLKEKSGGRRLDWEPLDTEGSWGVEAGWGV